jgi:hypothetical protein
VVKYTCIVYNTQVENATYRAKPWKKNINQEIFLNTICLVKWGPSLLWILLLEEEEDDEEEEREETILILFTILETGKKQYSFFPCGLYCQSRSIIMKIKQSGDG